MIVRDLKRYLPSLLTIGNICCGFLAVAIGDLLTGSLFLLAGIILDTFDGLLARAFNVQSEMGKELDSLADMITFGIAPAFLYSLLSPINHWSYYLAPAFFVVGAAIRLAKFNIAPASKHFIGLATPFATLFLVGIFMGVQFDKDLFINSLESSLIYFLIPFVLMLLMVSNIRMFSLKNYKDGWSSNILPLICLGFFILFLIIDFRIAFSAIVIVYIFLSILEKIIVR